MTSINSTYQYSSSEHKIVRYLNSSTPKSIASDKSNNNGPIMLYTCIKILKNVYNTESQEYVMQKIAFSNLLQHLQAE